MEPPSSPNRDEQEEMRMHRTRLVNLLNERHPLVKLALQIDWRLSSVHAPELECYLQGQGS